MEKKSKSGEKRKMKDVDWRKKLRSSAKRQKKKVRDYDKKLKLKKPMTE